MECPKRSRLGRHIAGNRTKYTVISLLLYWNNPRLRAVTTHSRDARDIHHAGKLHGNIKHSLNVERKHKASTETSFHFVKDEQAWCHSTAAVNSSSDLKSQNSYEQLLKRMSTNESVDNIFPKIQWDWMENTNHNFNKKFSQSVDW